MAISEEWKNMDILNLRAKDIMSKNPILFDEDMLVENASKESRINQ